MKNIEKLYCSPDTELIDILKIFNDAKIYDLPVGIALVVDSNNKLVGTITEGDVRRNILSNRSLNTPAKTFMRTDPITFPNNLSISEIIEKIPLELASHNRKSRKYLSKIIMVDKDGIPDRILPYHEIWEQKVAIHRHIVVIGLGYVGLTFGLVVADQGFIVTGYDTSSEKLKSLRELKSYIHEIGLNELLQKNYNKNFFVSDALPEDADVFIISVGTPIRFHDSKKIPVMNYLDEAIQLVSSKMKRGALVILRSTVPIGSCRKRVIPELEEKTGLKCGIDFHLAFAPERTIEGKALQELRTLPQVIGGFNEDSTEAAVALFREITPTIVRVSSLEVAEMVKLLNNTYRDYIFSYSNLMAKIASRFNIDIHEAIRSANEGYPRDRIPFPSPGVGGPCLTKDPYILANSDLDDSTEKNYLLNSREINESMYFAIIDRLEQQIKSTGKNADKTKILVCGLAFKGEPETDDLRHSTAIEIINQLKLRGYNISGFDPVASPEQISGYKIIYEKIPEGFAEKDVLMFLNNHKSFEKLDLQSMVLAMNEKPIIFDGWNLFRAKDIINIKPSVYMGISHTISSIE